MSRKDHYLSYSSYKTYRECPKKYKYRKVDKLKPPVKDSKHNALVGSVVQRVFEDFYNLEFWRKGPKASETLLGILDKYFYEFLDNEYVNFDDVRCPYTQQELLDTCRDLIPKVIQGIKDHKLLGPYAQSEITLRAHFEKNFFLFGRVDFVIKRPDGQILLMDGKASKHREKYVDEEQLLYYALAYQTTHGKLPDKLGFFFFRFADKGEEAIDWIEPTPERLSQMKTQVGDTFRNIQRKAFKATPSGSACKYCEFATICPERQAQLKVKRDKKRWRDIEAGKDVVPTMEEAGAEGYIGFGGVVKPKEGK
jgi:CRISPR/Cas system-associated exonuclease Cas4 (RecB family)